VMSRLKRGARWMADVGGAFAASRWLTRRLPRILMYHQFSAPGLALSGGTPVDLFRQQLAHITRRYEPIRLHDLSRAYVTGEPLPPRSVAITIDDGHASFLRWAFPVLQELGVPATLFVVSDLLEPGRWLWTDQLMYLRAAIPTLASEAGLTALKQLPPPERARRVEHMARQAGVTIPSIPPEPYALLSRPQIKEIARSGLIEIGSHTRTHATLSSIDGEQSWDEVAGSRTDLAGSLDVKIDAFCYPNGHPCDYRPQHVALAATAGYLCATAAHFGFVTAASDRFALPRIGCDGMDMTMFRKYVDGFEYLQRRVRGERCW